MSFAGAVAPAHGPDFLGEDSFLPHLLGLNLRVAELPVEVRQQIGLDRALLAGGGPALVAVALHEALVSGHEVLRHVRVRLGDDLTRLGTRQSFQEQTSALTSVAPFRLLNTLTTVLQIIQQSPVLLRVDQGSCLVHPLTPSDDLRQLRGEKPVRHHVVYGIWKAFAHDGGEVHGDLK